MPRDSAAPAAKPEKPPASTHPLVKVACLAAATTCLWLTQASEGFVSKAKPDPVGILTGCYGERVDMSDLDPNKVYSKSECGARLRRRLAEQYGPPVAACAPELLDPKRVNMFGAFLDAAWNAGPKNVCASPMAAALHAGDDVGACLGFLGWKVAPRGKYLTGLLIRREKETVMCFGRKQ